MLPLTIEFSKMKANAIRTDHHARPGGLPRVIASATIARKSVTPTSPNSAAN
jgi:hypothetical protein